MIERCHFLSEIIWHPLVILTHWQCDRNLPKCLEYMLDKQIICDVTFIMGAEHEEVHAHKFVLISRSPVFYAMFEGPLAEKGKVELPDVEKDIFLVFLRYVKNISYKIFFSGLGTYWNKTCSNINVQTQIAWEKNNREMKLFVCKFCKT